MQLLVPKNPPWSQMRITARSTSWSYETTLDDSFHSIGVSLPPGLSEDDVEAFAQFLDNGGHSIGAPVVIKTKVRQRRARPGT